jgi:hypothetical protein
MKKIVIIFFVSCGLSRQIQFIPFDWSGQFGYVNKNGAIMWNQDWQSGRLLFDGTWSVYPKMYGNEIEEGFVSQSADTSSFDSSLVKSYFKYDQGDYLLDRFSLGTNYTGNGRQIHFHAFKRSFYGAYGQYNNQSNQPIQQSYLGSYESNKGKDHGGISLGHFNTLSGFADSTSRGLIDSRITTSNTFWNHDFSNFHSKISIDKFLQRFRADHSISAFTGVRYSTRSRLVGELKWKDLVTAGTELNKRSVRQDSLITTLWNLFYLKGNISFIDLKIGITQVDDKSNINYQFGLKYPFKSFSLSAGIEQIVKPVHPYYLFNYEINPLSVISGNFTGIDWKGDHSNASIIFSILNDNNDYWDVTIPDTGTFFNERGAHGQLNINYETSWIPFVDLEMKYASRSVGNLYGGGIGYRLGYNATSQLSLFDGFMLVDLRLGVDQFIQRRRNAHIHPIEMVPMTIYTEGKMDDIVLLNGSITAHVSTFTIRYEWFNITEMILASIGSDKDNYFEIHPEMPLLGRQTNLSVEWDFLD